MVTMPDQQNDPTPRPLEHDGPPTEGVWLVLVAPEMTLFGTYADRRLASERASMIAGILAGPIPIAERHDD